MKIIVYKSSLYIKEYIETDFNTRVNDEIVVKNGRLE